MNYNQLRIRDAGRRMTVLLKLGGFISGIITILALFAIYVLTFSKEDVKASFLAAFHVTANNGTVIRIEPQQLLCMFSFMLIDMVLILFLIYFVHGIFSNIGKGCTPFSHRNTIRIKIIAVISLILSVVGGCSDALVDYYTIGELTWRVNVIGLVISIIIYCISLIFEYGCDLQRESDETL